MVTKSKAASKAPKKSRVKAGKLKLNKETLKDLTGDEARRIKGGAMGTIVGTSRACGGTKGYQP
jgi:hypothetical protein